MKLHEVVSKARATVADMVRAMIPQHSAGLSEEDSRLAQILRGNKELLESLNGVIQVRIAGRASVAEPSDPLMCKSMLARDRELQWLLGRLEYLYRSPVQQEDEGEQPA